MGDSEDVITATNQTEGYFGDGSCGRMEQGHGRVRCSFFFFFSYLINVKGTAGRDVHARLMARERAQADRRRSSGGGMTKGTCNS